MRKPSTKNRKPVEARIGYELSSVSGAVQLRVADGALLEVRPIVLDVVKGASDDGEPVYFVSGGFAVRVMDPPEEQGGA